LGSRTGNTLDQGGISFCDNEDGVHFDTLQVKLLIKDSDMPTMLKLDPAVIKFPNGEIACYFGAVPPFNPQGMPKLLVAWAKKPTGVKIYPSGSFPIQFRLKQNFPNPFNPSTTIHFSLPQRSHITLQVFDVLGREVATLVHGELEAGEHSVVYNAKGLKSGVYSYRLTTTTFSQTNVVE